MSFYRQFVLKKNAFLVEQEFVSKTFMRTKGYDIVVRLYHRYNSQAIISIYMVV